MYPEILDFRISYPYLCNVVQLTITSTKEYAEFHRVLSFLRPKENKKLREIPCHSVVKTQNSSLTTHN